MDDRQILEWVEAHVIGIYRGYRKEFYSIQWLDNHGHQRSTAGCNLKDCVLGAILDPQPMADDPSD